jgi:hypothetical protein
MCDHGTFLSPDLLTQDALPTSLFDESFAFFDTPPKVQPPPTCSFARFSSRLPSLDDTENDYIEEEQEAVNCISPDPAPWSISESVYEALCLDTQSYAHVIPAPACTLPSLNNMRSYLETYIKCAGKMLPFIHAATFSAEKRDVELVLAVALVGALYRFEYPSAYKLYFMAKAILMEKIRCESLRLAEDLICGHTSLILDKRHDLARIQTFNLLISFASWADKKLLPDALSMGSQLAMLIRENGVSEPDELPQDMDWLSWVAVEERRRTLLSAFVLLSLHTLAYNTPPLLLNHEVGLFLPGFVDPWEANNATQWRQAIRPVELSFKQGLDCLFNGNRVPEHASVSAFANYLLVHGLLQQLYIDRRGFTAPLQPETVKLFETALHTWQASWELTHESSLDPLSPKGPLGLTATALLRIAYIRLHSNLGTSSVLLSREPSGITRNQLQPARMPHVDRAVLHAIHALSIPVRLGVAFMALSKTAIWTIEHSLCSLECALVLKYWLEMIVATVQSSGTKGLRKVETKLLGLVTSIIKETCVSEALNVAEDEASHFRRISSMVTAMWATMFQGAHVLEIDKVVGASLQLLANSNPE